MKLSKARLDISLEILVKPLGKNLKKLYVTTFLRKQSLHGSLYPSIMNKNKTRSQILLKVIQSIYEKVPRHARIHQFANGQYG